jgi:L,D-peptidoglycan transpeptidase YkuD (ErfK/YbiS/YcfS/YnhG family)
MTKKGTRRIGCSGSRRVGFFCFRIVALFIIFLIQLSCLRAVDRGGHDTEKQEGTPRYALAENFVPVMNDPELPRIFGGKDGAQLSIDACGHMRELEFVALPGTVFNIEGTLIKNGVTVCRVNTADYPYPSQNGYYIDSRFVRTLDFEPSLLHRKLPERETIIASLIQAEGSRYVWGGNCVAGISRLLSLYPPAPVILRDWELVDRWMLRGVDCSGLLYHATNGYTPRNTLSLVHYGQPVGVDGLSTEDIARKLKPLDLIVWNGHAIIVLDSMRVIESRPGCPGFKGGVVVTPLKERLTEIMQERVPTDDPALAAEPNGRTFVVRRWYYSSNMAAGNKVSTSEAACDILDAVPSITELPQKFGESTQLLMVSSCHPKSICATVQAFQREGKQWRPVFSAMQAVIGKNGFAPPGVKKEGDGKTPAGIYHLGFAFGYEQTLQTGLPYRQITEDDVWVDDPASVDYNLMVKRSETSAASFERMRSDDMLYKYGIVLEYNMNPVVKDRGSAIFFHVRQGACVPTVGCIALTETDLLSILRWLNIREKPVAVLGTADMIRAAMAKEAVQKSVTQ